MLLDSVFLKNAAQSVFPPGQVSGQLTDIEEGSGAGKDYAGEVCIPAERRLSLRVLHVAFYHVLEQHFKDKLAKRYWKPPKRISSLQLCAWINAFRDRESEQREKARERKRD